jgi:hypothetical protein
VGGVVVRKRKRITLSFKAVNKVLDGPFQALRQEVSNQPDLLQVSRGEQGEGGGGLLRCARGKWGVEEVW